MHILCADVQFLPISGLYGHNMDLYYISWNWSGRFFYSIFDIVEPALGFAILLYYCVSCALG